MLYISCLTYFTTIYMYICICICVYVCGVCVCVCVCVCVYSLKVVEKVSPITWLKSIKNAAEIAGLREVCY